MSASGGRPPNHSLDLRASAFRRHLLAEAQAELAAELRGEDDPPLPRRLDRDDFYIGTRQRRDGPEKLTPRHAALIGLLLAGVDQYEAGAQLKLQRKAVRRLLLSPVFVAALEAKRVIFSDAVWPSAN